MQKIKKAREEKNLKHSDCPDIENDYASEGLNLLPPTYVYFVFYIYIPLPYLEFYFIFLYLCCKLRSFTVKSFLNHIQRGYYQPRWSIT